VAAPIGIVGQELKLAGALTFRFQEPRSVPVVVKEITAPDEPPTTGTFDGSVAEKVIEAGVIEALVIAVKLSFGLTAAGATFAAGCAPDASVVSTK